ncbi:hypothetical protein [Guggenheimella bovis]
MKIERIDSYEDKRFSARVLNQHGAYLVDGKPFEIEITEPDTAIVRGDDTKLFPKLIETFILNAPHIRKFYDKNGMIILKAPEPTIISLELDNIQPSQFYVDRAKLDAVRTFIKKPEDIFIQVFPHDGYYICLDGHSRLYLAFIEGYKTVQAVISETDEYIWTFVNEAKRRGICNVGDMKLVSHEEYCKEWDEYCDEVFNNKDGGATKG